LLQAADVSFAYGPGLAGLHGVSIDVGRGGLVGIIGPNGSGKTTLLRLLGGMLPASAGRVTLDGRDVARIPRRELARQLAVVPQETRLSFEYSVIEVVLMGRYPHLGAFELESQADLAIARDALAATGTLALEGRRFPTLSGGEKQRVIIASALAQSARLMLLDEPTAALDPGFQIEIAALLRRLNEDRGVTMAVATHDLNLAAGLCRDLVLLREGRVLASGPTEQVLTRESVLALYDVEADVRFHEGAGHLTVVPLRRVAARER
jgi:ABC-type cobalamin/Fe3+-siderophores transport system ATPase subunit